MRKSLYFLFATPVLASYESRYGINYFRTRNWTVYIWDLSPILNPLAHQKVVTGLADYSLIQVFRDKKDYKQYFSRISDDAFLILTMDFNYDTFFVYRWLKKTQNYGYLSRMDTNVEVLFPSEERVKRLLSDFSLRRIKNSIFIRIPRWILPIKAAAFLILGGTAQSEDYISLCFTGKKTCVKFAHSLDYENYLNVKETKKRIVKERYCLFLDQYLPYHPDNLESGKLIEPQKYYEELNEYFHYIEHELHIKVVIAVHPRSNYDLHKEIFSEFIIKKNITCELMKDAEFAMAHFSTALSYAALYYKPVILLSTDDFKRIKSFDLTLGKYAGLLGASIVNISDKGYKNRNIEQSFTVNADKYNSFIVSYIKADYRSPEKNDESIYVQIEKLLMQHSAL